MKNPLLFVVAAFILAGCGKTISADDYNQSCNSDADCRTVQTGDICDCSCEVGAINAEQTAWHESDLGSIKKDCAEDIKSCKACETPKPSYCNAGTCAIR
jgi:hypothetical protein